MEAGTRTSILEAAGLEPDPVIEAYKNDVDRTLLRERLKRTVDERLRDLERMQAFVHQIREAGRRTFG